MIFAIVPRSHPKLFLLCLEQLSTASASDGAVAGKCTLVSPFLLVLRLMNVSDVWQFVRIVLAALTTEDALVAVY